MELIIKQIKITETLPFPKDIRNIINTYISGSIPTYLKWIKRIYYEYIIGIIGDRINIFNEKVITRRILDIFLDNYGMHIKIFIEKLSNDTHNTLINVNNNVAKQIYSLFRVDFSKDKNPHSLYDYDELCEYLDTLWEKYRDPFFIATCSPLLPGSTTNYTINMDNIFIEKVKNAWSTGLDPYNKDPISGENFILWIFKQFLTFNTAKEQYIFEDLIIEMLATHKYDDDDDCYKRNILISVLENKYFEGFGKWRKWSFKFIQNILKLMNLAQLTNERNETILMHETLLNYILKINSREARVECLQIMKTQQFNFNYRNENNETCLFRNCSNLNIFEDLLKIGVNPYLKNKRGETILEQLHKTQSETRYNETRYNEIIKIISAFKQ